MYALGKDESGNINLYRITVEETYQDKYNTNDMRFHNLRYIEKAAEVSADALTGKTSSGGSATSATDYNVADLYDFVKRNDKDFTAGKPINKEFINSDGTPKVFYHGTPNGTFTEFRDWQYFTQNKDYAGNYLNQGASSNGYKKTASNPKIYESYLTAKKVFDTRRADAKKIFDEEFYGKWGNGTPLSDRGLPDWTDGDDLIEFLEEKGYDYDAIILDEGGTGGYGNNVLDRGLSYVIKDSSQIKSATDNIGTFSNSKDINYSTKRNAADSNGNALSEQQAEYFADSKIRDEDGNLLVVYHGTSEKFTVFDRAKGRSTADIQGMFFSPWEIEASGYGDNVGAYYLNITNPANESTAYKALRRFQGQNDAGAKARDYLESLGYDGVDNEYDEFVAFRPEQIKRIDNKNPTVNPDTNYSESRDTEYLELAKDPVKNEAKLNEMVKQAAENAGYNKEVYHGTTYYGDITKFKKGRAGYLGAGIYLAKNRSLSNRYANAMGEGNGKIYDLYVKANNPLTVTTEHPAKEILNTIYGSDRIYNNRISKQSFENLIITSKDIQKLKDLGYDAVIWDYSTEPEMVVFNSSQIKSADPVTYDDNGNIIPLSERFNEQNDDIRYSVKRSAEGFKYVEIEDDILISNGETLAQTLSDIISNKFNKLIEANGQQIKVNADTKSEWRYSKDASTLLKRDKTAYYNKMRAFNNADELVRTAKDWINEKAKHKNYSQFARGFVNFEYQGNGYSAEIVVGISKSGSATLYDLVNIQDKKITELQHSNAGASLTAKKNASVTKSGSSVYVNNVTALSQKSQDFSEKREQSNLSEFVSMSDELLEQKRIAEANANELNNLTEFPARKLNQNDIASVVKDLCNTAKAHR